jgi:hypothetical protein
MKDRTKPVKMATVVSDDDNTETPTRRVEEITVSKEHVLATVAEIIEEGTAFRVMVKNQDDKTLLDIPVVVGAFSTALFPVPAAITLAGIMVANLKVVVERKK